MNAQSPDRTHLPVDLPADARTLLFEGGRQLAIVQGTSLTLYDVPAGREARRIQLEGVVAGLGVSSLGLTLALRHDEGWSLWNMSSEHGPLKLLASRGEARALAVANGYAYIAATDDAGAYLSKVDLRQRQIERTTRLDTSANHLAVDPVTARVVVSSGVRGGLRVLDADLAPLARMAHPVQPHVHDVRACGCPHPCDCCCPRCRPACDGQPGVPGNGSSGEARPEPPTPPPEHDPARPPGQVAVPADDGGIITSDGGRVDHWPPPGSGRRPCGYSLFWEVGILHRYGSYVLAISHDERQAALFTADLDLVREWNLGRGNAHFVPSADAPVLWMLERTTRRWEHLLLDDVATMKPGLDRYAIVEVETKTFIGQQTYSLSHDKNNPKLPLKTLLVPVIEGGQTFSSPNLTGFAAFMTRTMYPYVHEFYGENSFGKMTNKDFEFVIFGASGGPLKLPRNHVADYYYPTYIPARVELTRTGMTAATPVVFDGRESLTIDANAASGSSVKGTVTLAFFAIGFEREQDLFPVSFKFLGNETLTLQVTEPDGTARTLASQFTPRSFDIADDAAVAAKLGELATYLDDVFKAAELAAGATARLFATPKVNRVRRIGLGFGRLLVTIAAANTAGNRLRVTSASAVAPGGDPVGLNNPLRGALTGGDTTGLTRYLDNALLLAQDNAPPFAYNNRLFEVPACAFDAAKGELKTTISISNRYGGIGAAVKVTASVAADPLFASAAAQPNSATSFQSSEALRDRGQLYQDALTAAIDRLQQEGKPLSDLKGFGCVLVMPVEPGVPNPADKDAVLPGEAWTVTALHMPFDMRGAEDTTTVEDGKKRIDPATNKPFQIQAGFSLIYMANGKPDNPLIVHELGHVLNFADLYREPPNYRDDLAYMETWAMMDKHPGEAHHCGYHKLQAHWIPYGAGTETDYGRVFPVGLPAPAPPTGGPGAPKTWELLLAPLELWRDSLVASSRAAFGVGDNVPVVQLAHIDLGGDGATFVLVEARQPGARFSKKLPGGPGVLITNGITWNLDERFAHANQYRRPLHLLNPSNILRNLGDKFDLAHAPELALKGTVVEVLGTKLVEGDAIVYRIMISRENAEFVDLYFADGNPYYKSPDLWVDWAGNNGPNQTYSDKEEDIPKPPLGTPTDQGEAIWVHPSRDEHNWLASRVRNRGQVKALDVKLDFYICDPPGAGDRGKNFKQMGTATIAEVAGGDTPHFKALRWDVAPGTKGHSCLLVRIEDYRIPEDSTGAALGSDDVWQINNAAQKNVDKYEAVRVNPYTPIEFDFSVNNEGVAPELAYLEPEHLPFGMTLSVSPPRQMVPAGKTVLFHCKLELDSRIIAAGCRNDQRFRITAWREHAEAAARWGGVEYEIRPREKTAVELTGSWDNKHAVELKGKVTPNPGGGTARLRLDYTNNQPRWVKVDVAPDGSFAWTETAPSNSRLVEAVGVFDANRLYASSRSPECVVKAPPIIH